MERRGALFLEEREDEGTGDGAEEEDEEDEEGSLFFASSRFFFLEGREDWGTEDDAEEDEEGTTPSFPFIVLLERVRIFGICGIV